MPNKHLEHPEDLILTGETWVVDAMFGQTSSSLKIDGCPAVVWGTHPETGKFFVGTKSVFNKKLIKINYEHSDILRNHPQEELQRVLSACLSYLPRTEGVYQGDFIGFGGSQLYTPNTLTYDFGRVVTANIIIAPHTQYHIPGPMCEAEASPLTEDFTNTPGVMFVQPIVDRMPQPEDHAWHVGANQFNWLSDKEAYRAKQGINALIKSGQTIDIETLTGIIGDENLATLYWLVMALKAQVMESYIIYNSPKCYIGEGQVQGEGFVMASPQGSFKLVDRYQFSYANFTQGKFS
ncbi:hypothetical protein [Synechococcus phage S-N03]|uniref:Uncharacterized protein n=1 Tax=Synechococcus phage S-N03 TaxID=2718943 RepID=A0A6G8R5N2_9CAUD|nr:hypothetical protein PQC09_gp061 [Synechococcus phage S-N03]QIN96696.1 hypothetical protein [Synechococcus phage S-N03]